MSTVEIGITCSSPDVLSVSIDYQHQASPLVKKCLARRAVVDRICGEIHRAIADVIAEPPRGADKDRLGEEAAARLRGLGLALFQELLKDECDRVRNFGLEPDSRSANAEADAARDPAASAEAPCMIFKLDKSLAYLPLELMHDGSTFLSRRFSTGRIIYADDAGVGGRSLGKAPRTVVIIGDPSEDPAIAADVEREVELVRDIFRPHPNFALRIASGREADTGYALANLPGTAALHFVGHGVVGEDDSTTGLKLSSGEILSGRSLDGLQDGPAFVFLNVCTPASQETWRGSLGVVEVLLRRGTRACIASLWEVGSQAASVLAERVYAHLVAGLSFGEALRRARSETADRTGEWDPTWAAYALYGDPRRRLVDDGPQTATAARGEARPWVRYLAFAALILGLAALVLVPTAIMREADTELDIGAPDQQAEGVPADTGGASSAPSEVAVVGYLVVQSTPKDARLLVDGEPMGITPCAIEVPVGSHEVAVEKPGFRRWEASVDVRESPRVTIDAVLEKTR
jgi:hypothetical protein